jgi:hypothetical protein
MNWIYFFTKLTVNPLKTSENWFPNPYFGLVIRTSKDDFSSGTVCSIRQSTSLDSS